MTSQSLTHPQTPAEACLFGYPVHLVTPDEARQAVSRRLEAGESLQVVTLNPEMIMQGEKDPELGSILKNAGLVLPDGAGVVWALRRNGHPVSRLPGIEFSENLLKWAAENGHAVALVGAAQEALELAAETLKLRYPGLKLAYAHHGFFQPGVEEERIARDCAAAQPRIVLVALGVPRQEKWIARWRSLFQSAVFVGIGGSLDVWSGRSRRAPGWMRRLNLEWLYRITSEPWRIRRTYQPLSMFVVKVLLSGRP